MQSPTGEVDYAQNIGSKIWGQANDDEEAGENGRPKRRLAKGLADLGDFLDDGEESD